MLTAEENALLTMVGPGSPAGQMLRYYWWPIGFSTHLQSRGAPVAVRILGEDLVLYRDGQERLGLVALHCSHRGTSLEYGRVEDDGIRCPYHGWLYARDGQCLEQPAEPEDSTYKDRIRHSAYQVQELGGLIFAYLGPDPAPLLPHYDVLLREDGTRVVGAKFDHCNWLQVAENAVDQGHLPFLHASVYPEFAMKRPDIDWERTWYGIKATTYVPGVPTPKFSHYIFPTSNRVTTARVGTTPDHNIRWRVPVDDTRVANFWLNYYPNGDGKSPEGLKTLGWRQNEPGVYGRTDDGFWGIASQDQDRMAEETQGVIFNREAEHLGASDRAVIMLREMVKESILAVREGRDPVGVVRDIEQNETITFDAQMDEIGVLV
jgi:5,5'-dehydrodivanillate O-demethylase oxygenase subunit